MKFLIGLVIAVISTSRLPAHANVLSNKECREYSFLREVRRVPCTAEIEVQNDQGKLIRFRSHKKEWVANRFSNDDQRLIQYAYLNNHKAEYYFVPSTNPNQEGRICFFDQKKGYLFCFGDF